MSKAPDPEPVARKGLEIAKWVEADVEGVCILIERREGSAQRRTYLGVDER